MKKKPSHYEDTAKVLLMQSDELKQLKDCFREDKTYECEIDSFLLERGIIVSSPAEVKCHDDIAAIVVPAWEQLVEQADNAIAEDRTIDELFTKEELRYQSEQLNAINQEFNVQFQLDKTEVSISVIAGLISAAVDLFLIGVPEKTFDGLKSRPLGDFVREQFEKWFSPEEMQKLEKMPVAKVPYDVPYNTGFTNVEVEGLWPTMHRLYSLGHDPVLGFIVGVHDILTGQMTTIDKLGHVVVQEVERYAGRDESTLFAALAKQLLHFRTDVTTSMGLPAPFMSLFNLLQFGNIGEDDQTIAEIVQGMYYEGYDFVHFCSQSIPVMLTEVIVRLCYFAKRIKEGHNVRESIPFSLNREKHPKLATMLFVSHSTATAIDVGKVYFTKNPTEINYPQMLAFSFYAISQLKWDIVTKPELRHKHVVEILQEEIGQLEERSAQRLEQASDYEIIYL